MMLVAASIVVQRPLEINDEKSGIKSSSGCVAIIVNL